MSVTPAYLGDACHQPHSQAAGREPWEVSEGQGVASMESSENSIYGEGSQEKRFETKEMCCLY